MRPNRTAWRLESKARATRRSGSFRVGDSQTSVAAQETEKPPGHSAGGVMLRCSDAITDRGMARAWRASKSLTSLFTNVAQASKPAVSQVSKPAGCTRCTKPSECSYRDRIEGRVAMESCKVPIYRLKRQSRGGGAICRLSRIGRPLRFMSGNAKRPLRRFGNLRYSRLGSLRYAAVFWLLGSSNVVSNCPG